MVYSEPRSGWLGKRADAEAGRAGFPDEAEISYAVPVRRGGRLVAAFFVTIAVPTEDRTNFHFYRPIGRFELDWQDGSLITRTVREDVLPVEQDTPVGLGRPHEFAGPVYGEEEERCIEVEEELLRLIDTAAPLFAAGGDDPAVRGRCLATFRRLVPEAIRPLYEDLGPEYFRWLETGVVPVSATCPSCGDAVAVGDRFCGACGATLSFPTCPSCGSSLGTDDRFCGGCGRSVAPEPGAAETMPASVETEPIVTETPTTTPETPPAERAWAPSHTVPSGGLSAWGRPDPTAPVIARLDPGLPVLVTERAGDWAQVVASNGWTGWVDGRSLVPLGT
ncbi:MAG: zinc ribbon domain-containing protein [Actinomycetota bacterium]